MFKKIILSGACLICSTFIFAQNANQQLIDNNWAFYRGGAQGAEKPNFDDSKWKKVDLPHDWSIEDLPGTKSPFNPGAISQANGGFTTGGTAWYRKTLDISSQQKGKRVIIRFDGIYMNATVFVNGINIGQHPYGYTGFSYDITDELKTGSTNVVAVEVKNEGQNSRWYSGSGIYRHVWLKVVDPVQIAPGGQFITTPEVSESTSRVNIISKVINDGSTDDSVQCIVRIINPAGAEIGKIKTTQIIKSKSYILFNYNAFIPHPALWDCDKPSIYSTETEIYKNGMLTDKEQSHFGIRKITFDAENGFSLNGKTIKLKGGCVHNDNGPLGSRAYDRAEERKVELLRASGFNAIRCAHNPPSTALLDACDRLGMLVIDEAFDCWMYGKNAYDYHLYFKEWWKRDVEEMLTRDRNHPSVMMWSIGNEIPGKESPDGVATAKEMADFISNIDPTRAITSAVNDLKPDKDPFFAALTVGGYNYGVYNYDKQQVNYEGDHARVPERVMCGSESYALEAFGSWMEVIDHPYVIGDFIWTAWDYMGEASIGWRGYEQESNFYPWNLAYCGDIDICGWKRPQSYYRDALWKKNSLAIFVTPPKPSFPVNSKRQEWSKWHWLDAVASWNWAGYEDKLIKVNLYSSCESVELFLNGHSLGKKESNRNSKFMATWDVPYKPGILKAVGYKNGKVVNTSILQTASKPVNINIEADKTQLKTNNQDLSYISIKLQDAKGTITPNAENILHFKIEGPGSIVAVGNANPTSLESNQMPQRKAWRGKCLVIVKSGNKAGKIKLTVSTAGLASKSILLKSL